MRKLREKNLSTEEKITEIFNQLKIKFPLDWLLNLEIYELALQHNFSNKEEILLHLQKLQENSKFKKLITNGLNLLQ